MIFLGCFSGYKNFVIGSFINNDFGILVNEFALRMHFNIMSVDERFT